MVGRKRDSNRGITDFHRRGVSGRWFVSSLIIAWALVLSGCGAGKTPTPTPIPTQAPTSTPPRYWEETRRLWDGIEDPYLALERSQLLRTARESFAPIGTYELRLVVQYNGEILIEFTNTDGSIVSQKYVWNGERWRYVGEYCENRCR